MLYYGSTLLLTYIHDDNDPMRRCWGRNYEGWASSKRRSISMPRCLSCVSRSQHVLLPRPYHITRSCSACNVFSEHISKEVKLDLKLINCHASSSLTSWMIIKFNSFEESSIRQAEFSIMWYPDDINRTRQLLFLLFLCLLSLGWLYGPKLN